MTATTRSDGSARVVALRKKRAAVALHLEREAFRRASNDVFVDCIGPYFA
jgi:hypothetical protein